MCFSAVISPIPVRSGTNPSLTQSSPARMKKQVMRHTYRRTRHRIGPKAAIARTGKQLPANARRKHVPRPIRHSKSPGAEAHGALCSTRSTGAFCHSDPHCGPKPEYPPGDYLCTVNQRPEIDGIDVEYELPVGYFRLDRLFPELHDRFLLASGQRQRHAALSLDEHLGHLLVGQRRSENDPRHRLLAERVSRRRRSSRRRTRGRRTTRAFRRRPCGTPSKSCRRRSLHGR